MKIVTFDPGASGAMCISTDPVQFIDFKDGGILAYAQTLKAIKPDLAIVENVFSRTAQGVKSVFSFGERKGEIIGMLQTLDISYELVSPQKWQRAIGVPPKSGKKGIFSTVKSYCDESLLTGPKGGIKDGRCDALGILLWKQKELNNDNS